MKVTVITYYLDGLAQHYVGVVQGILSEEEKQRIAQRFEVAYSTNTKSEVEKIASSLDDTEDEFEEDESPDWICFTEVDIISASNAVSDKLNLAAID